MARQNRGYVKAKKLWIGVGSHTTDMTASGTSKGVGFTFTSPQTILRILGEYIIAPTAGAMTAGDNAFITVAMGVFSADAFNAGSGSLPDPAAEEGYPWLFWRQHAIWFGVTGEDPSAAGGSLRSTIDVKSMRKVTANQLLGVVVQYEDVVGTPLMTISFAGTRVLTTLH